MSFYMLFVAALLIAYSANSYVNVFGAKGLILKDYALTSLGLILLIPALGKVINKHPLSVFHLSVILEVLAVLGYFLTDKGFYPVITLPFSTFLLMLSVYCMRPLVTCVESKVINGSAKYSLLKSKLEAIYTALGSLFGATFVYFDVSTSYTISLLFVTLLLSRYYRNKVFLEIYTGNTPFTTPNNETAISA